MLIKDLPKDLQDALTRYFYTPYQGYVYLYNNLIVLKELERFAKDDCFYSLMSRDDTVDGKPSIWAQIFDAVFLFAFGKVGDVDLEANDCILDVGSRIGEFSIPFTDFYIRSVTNTTVVAVEPELLPCKVQQALVKIFERKNIEVVNSTIASYLATSNREFSLVLMLNVFDHILRQGEDVAWRALDELSRRCGKMVLMAGPTDQMPQENIPQCVLKHSQYTAYRRLLSNSYGGRELWGFMR